MSRLPGLLLIIGHAINALKHENKGSKGAAANLMTVSGLAFAAVVYGKKMTPIA